MSHRNTGATHDHLVLWGAPVSAWSGKVRAYLIKSKTAYEERFPVEDRFAEEIVPLIGYFVVPVVEMPDGLLMQDSTEVMQHLEAKDAGQTLVPPDPTMGTLAWMLNFFGSDGFFKPGMHYRWNFPDDNAGFIAKAFLHGTPDKLPMNERAGQVTDLMSYFDGYCERIGVYGETIPAIEASFMTVLDILDRHFAKYPYLLGGLPSVADCGFMTKFYAHLSRDPYPARLLKQRAHQVYRWTERMFELAEYDSEYRNIEPTYFKPDDLPETLVVLLKYLFSDYGPELQATLGAFDDWIEKQPANAQILEYPEGGDGAHPIFGMIEYPLRDVVVRRQAQVDTVFQYQKVVRLVDELAPEDRAQFDALLSNVGGGWMLTQRPSQKLAYENYTYVRD